MSSNTTNKVKRNLVQAQDHVLQYLKVHVNICTKEFNCMYSLPTTSNMKSSPLARVQSGRSTATAASTP